MPSAGSAGLKLLSLRALDRPVIASGLNVALPIMLRGKSEHSTRKSCVVVFAASVVDIRSVSIDKTNVVEDLILEDVGTSSRRLL